MFNWATGYSAQYYAAIVDPATWRDVGVIEITGGTIKRESTGERESAEVACVNYRIPVELWIRIYLDARKEDGSAAHVPLFTGIATTPGDDSHGTWSMNALECYSVLKPASDVYLQTGYYVASGSDAGAVITELLSLSAAPVIVHGTTPRITESIVAESGETHLSMVDRILTAIGWRLRIDGNGTINIMPMPTETVVTFDPIANDMIKPNVKITEDRSACPNVYMAVCDKSTGIARDDDPDSPLSTVSRGREVWAKETGVTLTGGESIAEYAARRLVEAQRVQQGASYARRYHPDVRPGDLIRMQYPVQRLTGTYRVDSQSVALGYAAETSEQIYKEL